MLNAASPIKQKTDWKEKFKKRFDEAVQKSKKIIKQKYRLGGYKGGQIGRKI